MKRLSAALVLGLAVVACRPPRTLPTLADQKREVEATERAFAATMAVRDHAAFCRFLAPDAVFFSGPQPLHGADAVGAYWLRYFQGGTAPFSWEPTEVEVLGSGGLALSHGPVRNPEGKVVSTFTSIWRREAHGAWRIIFDRGGPICDR